MRRMREGCDDVRGGRPIDRTQTNIVHQEIDRCLESGHEAEQIASFSVSSTEWLEDAHLMT